MSGKYLTSFDGAKIYYHKTVKDKNKWLVFLHGFGGDLTAWSKERAYFTKLGISSIAMDLRGHGLSEKSDDSDFYRLKNFAKDLSLLLREESIVKPVVIGHCFGGMVAIYFQAHFPNRSKGLILVDTGFKPPFISNNPVAKVFANYLIRLLKSLPNINATGHADFNKFRGTNDINFRRILSDILHTSLRSYLLMCQDLIKLDAKDLLDKIAVPTLVVEGTKDSIFPPEIAKYLAKRIKRSELDFIEGANHIIVLNNPGQLEEAVAKFLKKINFISDYP